MADSEMARCENRRGCRAEGQRKISGGRAEIGGALQQGPPFHPWASSRLPFFPLFTRGSPKVDVDDNGKRTRPLSTQWALRIQGHQGHQGHQQGHAIQVDCNTYFISNASWANATTVDMLGMLAGAEHRFSMLDLPGPVFYPACVCIRDTFDARIANMSSLEHVVLPSNPEPTWASP